MDIYIDEVLAGVQETIDLLKQGNNIFDMGNVSMFPNVDKQQKWRFSKNDQVIRLSDGQNVFSFKAPDGFSEENEFMLHRSDDAHLHNFEEGALSKGLAQVHRADPGSIYFTIQEGYKNPTYTFRHVGEDKWKAIPKRRKPKNATIGQERPQAVGAEVIQNVSPFAVKEAMEKMIKEASPSFFSEGLRTGANSLVHGMLTPGAYSPLTMAGAGAGGGALYHILKKRFYNTPEENEEEAQQGIKPFLQRTLIPALGLGAMSASQRSLLGTPDVNPTGYYGARNSGNKEIYDLLPKGF